MTKTLFDGFLGAILGGAVTLIGLRWTFRRERHDIEEQRAVEAVTRLHTSALRMVMRLDSPSYSREALDSAAEDVRVSAAALVPYRRSIGPRGVNMLGEALSEFEGAWGRWVGELRRAPSARSTFLHELMLLSAAAAHWLDKGKNALPFSEFRAQFERSLAEQHADR